MQAVILAAGKSTRTYPLTITRPKPLLPIANKPLLEHTLDSLLGVVNEVILIVGYKKGMIQSRFGKSYKGMRLRYVDQKEQLGTGHALLMAKPFIKGRLIVMAGDDLYSKQDIHACVVHKNSILVASHEHPERFGVIEHVHGKLINIIEKPMNFISNLINTSFYVLDPKIMDILTSLKKSERGEFELTDAVKILAKEKTIHLVTAKQHIAIGYPWDLLNADIALRGLKNAIGKNSTITGQAINSSIGDNCAIHGKVKNCIVMEGTAIEEGSFIENSVIGSNVRFSGKIRSKEDATSIINNKKVKAGMFGAAIGDDVVAQRVVISPGVKVWPKKNISGTISSDIP